MLFVSLILSASAFPILAQEVELRSAAEWDRIALEAGARFDTDAEMLAWLRSLELEESDRRRRELGRLAAVRERLRVTVWHEVEEELEWLELSPDGSLLATSDGTLRMWDAHTGVLLWETKGRAPRFTSDGRYLASAWQNTGALRDARTGQVVSAVRAAPETVFGLAIPETSGALLATITAWHPDDTGERLTLWDLGDGSVLAGPVSVGSTFPGAFAFDPTGTFFAASYEAEEGGCGVYLWSRGEGLRSIATTYCTYGALAFDRTGARLAVEDGEFARFFETSTGEVDVAPLPLSWCGNYLVFRDDGALAAGGWDEACVWDVDTRRLRSVPRWQDDLNSDYRDKYCWGPDDLSPNGTRRALGGLGDTLRIWSTETGAQLGAPLRHGMQADLAAFACDDRTVASGNEIGLVRVWDVEEGGPRQAPPTFVESRFSEEADGVRVSRWESTVVLVELATGEVREIQRGGRAADLAFERDGRGLAVGWGNGQVDLWSLTGERLGGPLRQPISAFGLAWQGDRLVTAEAGAIRVWDLKTGVPAGFVYGWGTPARCQLDASGEELVFTVDDAVERWSTDSWELISRLPATEDFTFLTLDPEGERAVRSGDGRLSLLDARTGVVLAETRESSGHGQTRFGTDGVGLLWEDWNDETDRGRLFSWDVEAGTVPRVLPTITDQWSQFSWHSGSHLLAVTSRESERSDRGTIHLLDARDGRIRGEPIELPGLVEGLVLDPSGEWLAASHGRWVDEFVPLSWASSPAGKAATDDDEWERRVLARAPGGDLVAAIDEQGRLELWNSEDNEPLDHPTTHPGGHPVAIAPDGTLVHLRRGRLTIEKVNLSTGECFYQEVSRSWTRRPLSIAIDAITGERAILFEDGEVDLFDADSCLRVPRALRCAGSPDLMAFGGAGRLAAFSRMGEVVVVEMTPASESLVVETAPGLVTALALDRSGEYLAVGSWSGEVRVSALRAPRGSDLELEFERPICALAFGAKGELAVGTADGAVRVVETSGRVGNEREPMDTRAAALGWLATGELVAVGRDGRRHSWSAAGELIRSELVLDLAGARVTHATFDRTGTRLAVAHEDHTILVWQLEDWRPCGPPLRTETKVEWMSLGSTGERASVQAGSDYRTYDVETGELIAGPFDRRGVIRDTLPLLWAGKGEFGEHVYRVVDLENGEALWQVPWSAHPMSLGQFSVGAVSIDLPREHLLISCIEFCTLLRIEGEVVIPLGTRRWPVGNETKTLARVLDDGRLLVGVGLDHKPAELTLLDFDDPGDVRLEGDASELRRLWEVRLGLRVVGDEIVRR